MRSLESQSLSACLTEGCQKEEGLHLLHVARRWDLFSGGADFGWPGLPHSRATLRQKELPEEREPLQPLELLRAPLCATHRKASRAPRISRLLHPAPWNKVRGHRGCGPQTGAGGEGNLYLPPVKVLSALARAAQWIELWPANQKVAGLITIQGTCLVAGQVPSWGCVRGNRSMYLSHTDGCLLFLPSFPSF